MKQDSPSDTAILIARSILLSADLPGHAPLLSPGEPEAIRHFLGERADLGWFSAAARHRWTRRLLITIERILLGGIFAHYLARKRWIERETRHAIENHRIKQLVIIGAGYDTLGWRLCQDHPGLACFELDHPATQRLKHTAPSPPPGFHLLPADLTLTSPEAILAKYRPFDPAKPSLVIVEGLTMYLHPPRVADLLDSCASIAGPRGKVIFTFMEMTPEGSLGFHGESPWIRRWLSWKKEPFHWGCTHADLPSFLKPLGLAPQRFADHHTLRSEILTPRGIASLPLARGESLCLCNPLSS